MSRVNVSVKKIDYRPTIQTEKEPVDVKLSEQKLCLKITACNET